MSSAPKDNRESQGGGKDSFRQCADAMPHVVWIGAPGGEIDYTNARWRELTGFNSDSPQVDWASALHTEDRAQFANAWNYGLKAGEPFELEFRLWSQAHKGYRWQLGRVQPLRDARYEISGWIGSCHDIHEQKTAQELLRTSEARLQSVISASPVGLVILNPRGDPVYYNRKCAELRGHEIDVGRWAEAVHSEDRERVVCSWAHAAKSGLPWEEIYRFVHPDGETVWVSGRAVPIRSEGELIGFIRTLEDVTKLKTVEEDLRAANQQLQTQTNSLEQEVRHRTARLREALAELDKLSYSIVHDMRAPLRSMHRFSRLLLQEHAEGLDDAGRELLQRIAAAAQRQDRLIQDVLAYHSYVRNEFPLEPVDLDELVNGILDTYATLQPPKVQVRVRRPLGWALAHETLLTQCVSALLNNAAKFVPAGVVPQILVWSEISPGQVKLWVEDNGIGIAPEFHQKIFNIFETLHRPEIYPGTGIGLPLARKALEKMRGHIGVESEVGKGARFWIALQKVLAA